MNHITVREISDDKTTISSTRWAFATVIKFDIVIVTLTIVAGIVSHFIGRPLDNGFYGSVAMLLGILTGLVTTSKALQGFEPHSKSDDEVRQEIKEEIKVEVKTKETDK